MAGLYMSQKRLNAWKCTKACICDSEVADIYDTCGCALRLPCIEQSFVRLACKWSCGVIPLLSRGDMHTPDVLGMIDL
jgi:hypothetical protein